MKASPLVERIRESNRQAADAWSRWAPHRARVMEVLGGLPREAARLCVLGAGQLNDVSVDELRHRYREITLVDLDVETVREALARHGVADARWTVSGPVDLTGILEALAGVPAGRVTTRQLLDRLATDRCDVPGAPFDVAASLGVLTQLLQALVDVVPEGGDLAALSVALRDKHLGDLVHLARPGGTIVLVTDVVATTTAPGLRAAAPADLERHMAALVAAGNFFTGTNPYRLVALLEEDDRFRAQVTDVRLVGPWLWAVTEDRAHLTCAVTARRRNVT